MIQRAALTDVDAREGTQAADRLYATRNEPKPMPISYHHGVLGAGSTLPLDGTDRTAACGFLGHAPVQYLAD